MGVQVLACALCEHETHRFGERHTLVGVGRPSLECHHEFLSWRVVDPVVNHGRFSEANNLAVVEYRDSPSLSRASSNDFCRHIFNLWVSRDNDNLPSKFFLATDQADLGEWQSVPTWDCCSEARP